MTEIHERQLVKTGEEGSPDSPKTIYLFKFVTAFFMVCFVVLDFCVLCVTSSLQKSDEAYLPPSSLGSFFIRFYIESLPTNA